MADYKRFVSYMYEYVDGVKKKNVGYVRVEIRNGECKFTISMRTQGLMDGIFPTYLIHRPADDMTLIYIGDSTAKNQMMNSRLNTNEINVMNSSYDFTDVGGMLLFLNSGVYYATQWDDKPVVMEEVLEALKPKSKKDGRDIIDKPDKKEDKRVELDKENIGDKMSDDISEDKLIRQADKPVYMLPGGWGTSKTFTPNQVKAPVNPWELVAKYKKYESNNVQNINIAEKEKVQDEVLENKKEQEMEPRVAKSAGNKEMASSHAEKIFDSYPRIYPFEDNMTSKCVKIEPKDMGSLPSELWALSNNSFLMHGYYCYNHIIVAEIKDRYGSHYILGVPGIYHNRERFMARMFGFECFKPIRKRELKQGDFGYWYIEFKL